MVLLSAEARSALDMLLDALISDAQFGTDERFVKLVVDRFEKRCLPSLIRAVSVCVPRDQA